MLNKNQLTFLSVFTLFGFSAIGYFILSFSDEFDYASLFYAETPILDVIYGLVGGSLFAGLGLLILQIPALKKVGEFYSQIFNTIHLTWPDILFYSFCAGVGEEILFRGAIQPFIGIWVTALVFVLLHGYISFKNLPKSSYGLYLILVAAAFGYAYEFFSIYSAMAAHFIYDVIMFSYLKRNSNQNQLQNSAGE
jgi:membrane protease YdiL (CAAX protease family)